MMKNAPLNHESRLQRLVMLVVIASAAIAGWNCWQHRVAQKARDWFADRPDASIQSLHDYDAQFLKFAADGNVAVRFLNLDPNNPEHLKFAQLMFCRGAYSLYPRRAWVVPEGTVVNGGKEAIEARFSPSAKWLQEHDVRTVIEARAEDADRIQIRAVTGGAP